MKVVKVVDLSRLVRDSHFPTTHPLVCSLISGRMEKVSIFDRIECLRGFVHRRYVCHEGWVQSLIPISLVRDTVGLVSIDSSA